MKQPPAVDEFISLVKKAHPRLALEVNHADAPDGDWWFDARTGKELLTVFWSPESGFGFSTQEEIGYGEKPNEIYVSPIAAAQRFSQILGKLHSGERASLGLAELRELRGMTQAELARAVGVEQAAISRLEGRENLELNTLRNVAEAMGMRLVVQIRAPGIVADIEPGSARKTRRAHKALPRAKTKKAASQARTPRRGGVPVPRRSNELRK